MMNSTYASTLTGDGEAIAGWNEHDFAKISKNSSRTRRIIVQTEVIVQLCFSERSQTGVGI